MIQRSYATLNMPTFQLLNQLTTPLCTIVIVWCVLLNTYEFQSNILLPDTSIPRDGSAKLLWRKPYPTRPEALTKQPNSSIQMTSLWTPLMTFSTTPSTLTTVPNGMLPLWMTLHPYEYYNNYNFQCHWLAEACHYAYPRSCPVYESFINH